MILDSLSNQKLLRRVLINRGIKCDSNNDGQEVLHNIKYNPNKYNIIFMDNLMPNMVRHFLKLINFRIF